MGLNSSKGTRLEDALSLHYKTAISKFNVTRKQTIVLIFRNTLGMICIHDHHQQSMVTILRESLKSEFTGGMINDAVS